LILFTSCLGAFMATLDTSIVNVALPQISQDFHATLGQVSWVIQIYLLLNASFLLTSGRLGDLLPPGKVYLLGLVVFTGASALCGFSTGLAWMVAARALQGLGASLMLGLAPKLIASVYGEGERGLALGLFSTAFATGISVGAPLGGLITAYLGWPYIFFINIPICTLALGLGGRSLRRLPAPGPWDRRAFDLWGGLALAGSLGFLILGLSGLKAAGSLDGGNWGKMALALGLFVFLIFLERRHPAPLLHPDLWRTRPFILGSLAVVLNFSAVMGVFFLLPFFLEQGYHYSPGHTGLMLAALSLTNGLVAPVGGYLADRFGNMTILRTGTAIVALGLGSLIFTGPEATTPGLAARLALIGLGFGLFQAPNLNEVLRGINPSLLGVAAGTNAVLKNLGALLGITLMVTVFAWLNLGEICLAPGVCLELSAFQSAFAVAAGVAAVNFLVNLMPRGKI